MSSIFGLYPSLLIGFCISPSMESASQLESNSETPHSPFVEILGTFIAFATLTLPLFTVAYFSSTPLDTLNGLPYSAVQTNE